MLNDVLYEMDKLTKTLSVASNNTVLIHQIPKHQTNELIRILSYTSINPKYLASWTSVSMLTPQEVIRNIENTVLENITEEAIIEHQEPNINYKIKKLAPKVRKKINYITNIKEHNRKESTTKNIALPVLATVSTLGISLGVPLFSTILFRNEQIINGINGEGKLGLVAYLFLISFAISLIILAVSSTIASLVLTIEKNKKIILATSLHSIYEKFIEKYFYFEKDDISESEKRKKFLIKRKFLFFYDSIDEKSTNYFESISLLKVIKKLGSKNFLMFDKKVSPEDKNIFKNEFDVSIMEFIDFSKYKTKINNKRIFNFIMYQITMITGLSTRLLLNKYKFFSNALYRFIDESSSNLDVLLLIYNIQKMLGSNQDIKITGPSIKYFAHLFNICVLMVINNNLFKDLLEAIVEKGYIDTSIKKDYLYSALKIDELLDENMLMFKHNSLYFRLANFTSFDITLREMISKEAFQKEQLRTKEEWKNDISADLSKRGLIEVQLNKYEDFDWCWRTEDQKMMVVKYIDDSLKISVLSYIDQLLKIAKTKQMNYLMFILYDRTIKFQLFDREYESTLEFLF